jgi:hypothetical protein
MQRRQLLYLVERRHKLHRVDFGGAQDGDQRMAAAEMAGDDALKASQLAAALDGFTGWAPWAVSESRHVALPRLSRSAVSRRSASAQVISPLTCLRQVAAIRPSMVSAGGRCGGWPGSDCL